MAKKKAKRRTSVKSNAQKAPSRAGSVLKAFITVILVLGILAGAGYCTWRFWLKDYIAEGKIFTVEIDGKVYRNGDGGILLAPGTELKVQTPHGKEYEVKILASEKTNFAFNLGAEPWEWKNMHGTEFTGGFAITKTEAGFRLNYESLNGIIEKVHGQQADVLTTESGDIFDLVITCDKKELKLTFGTYMPVTGVELDKSDYTFVVEG